MRYHHKSIREASNGVNSYFSTIPLLRSHTFLHTFLATVIIDTQSHQIAPKAVSNLSKLYQLYLRVIGEYRISIGTSPRTKDKARGAAEKNIFCALHRTLQVSKNEDMAPIYSNMPPVTGAIYWINSLRQRLKEPMTKIRVYSDQVPSVQSAPPK